MDMKSITQQLQNDIRAILEANLHPNQQKIDVHEPEKDQITAQDFKKLRDMKKGKSTKDTSMQKDEAVSPAQQAAIAISLIKAGKKKGTMPKPQREEFEQIDEISTKLLAKAAHSASDPMKHYDDDEKYHDPQKFADHAKKTKDAKSAAAVQGAADAKGHYPRPNQAKGYDSLASRSPARVTAAGKANKQDVNTLKKNIRNEDMELDEAEHNKPASPFDLKNYKSQLPSKPGEKAGFDSKKISTGTVYSRKSVKEESEATEYFTFAQFLEEARKLFDDKDAIIIANEAFNNQDITLISKQSQSPEA